MGLPLNVAFRLFLPLKSCHLVAGFLFYFVLFFVLKWAGWEHGLEAIVGEQSTVSHVCRQAVKAVMEGGQGGALPSLFLFLHSVLL